MKVVFNSIPLALLAFSTLAACGAAGDRVEAPAASGRGVRTAAAPNDVGFAVAAPDRGFLGNEELTDLFRGFAAEHNAALVFVTDERTGAELAGAVDRLAARGARRVVVLPMFLSAGATGFQTLEQVVARGRYAVPVELGQRLGASYLAVELLADRLRALHETKGRRLVVVGYGAADAAARDVMVRDLEQTASAAARGFGFESVRAVVWRNGFTTPQKRDEDAEAALTAALAGAPRAAVVPFQLGPRLDSMMSFPSVLGRHVRRPAQLADGELMPDPLVGLWMAREAGRHLPLAPDDVGVVVLAHGADHHWNQDMRRALAGPASRHRLEFAFSMADPVVVERAVKRLEARGARAIVVVRVFALASSFRGSVERMLGLDIEPGPRDAGGDAHAGHGGGHAGHGAGGHAGHGAGGAGAGRAAADDHGHGGHGHGHGGHGAALPAPRIRSAARFVTVGGIEDSPELAEALLERALAVSADPARETIILTAHGDGDDATNQHWREVLTSLAGHMKRGRGAGFRAIQHGTWREDWPDKREREVAAIRKLVTDAAAGGGRAIVVPARTIGTGPERDLLSGLDYTLGQGFAPHRLFEQWFEAQIRAGVAALEPDPGDARRASVTR